MTAPFAVAARPVGLEAVIFDGSDASAQTIALWVKERGDITWKSTMRYSAGSRTDPRFTFDPEGDGGWSVRPGQHIVRMAPRSYAVLTPDLFDLLYQRVDTLLLGHVIEESR